MITLNRTMMGRAMSVVAFALLACLLLTGDAAVAGPENPTVRHGQASFETSDGHTDITASNNAVIDYSSFNIGVDESVRFIQPHERARVLNRILGGSPSNIEGALTANGHVYFVNPAGVYFAGTAEIDVGGLHAAAGHMSVDDFVDGVDRFTDLQGEVVNAGTIEADTVALMGRSVTNTGTIDAGRVLALVAGEEVHLFEQGGRITVQVDGSNLGDGGSARSGEKTDVGVTNEGELHSGEQVTLGAGDMYSLAIRNRGKITASGGDVRAVANDGDISLADGSEISAAGEGDADGGEVIVNAISGTTRFESGSLIDVSGGPDGGDGGFAEVSGEQVGFHGTVLADGENLGTLLIDPWNIFIQEDPPADPGDGNVAPSALAASTADINILAENSIFVEEEVNLVHNNNVKLEAELSDIVFNARFLGARNLTADAGNEVVFNVTSAGPGDSIVQTSGRQRYLSPVVLNTDTALSTVSGGGIEFHDTVRKGPEASTARLALDTSGVTFAGDVGGADDETALTALYVFGTSNIGADSGTGPDVTIRTSGEQEYYGNVNLYAHTHLIAEDEADGIVYFAAEIDNFREGVELGQEANLLIDAGIGAWFDGYVSERTLVGSLRVNGATLMNAGRIATARDQIYDGPVYLLTDSVAVSTRGDVRFLGPVGTLSSEGESPGLIVHAEKINPFFQEPDNIDELDPVAAMRNGDVQFAGDVGGGMDRLVPGNGDQVVTMGEGGPDMEMGPLGHLYVFSAVNNDNPDIPGDTQRGVITFGGNEDPVDEISVNVIGDILLNPGGDQTGSPRDWDHGTGYANDLTSVPTIATIASADGDIVFNTTEGNFIMGGTDAGANKLTSLGKLTINAPFGSAVVGDLNAFISTVDEDDPVSISVTAESMTTTRFLNRPAGEVRMPDDSLVEDEGIDIVCQRAFRFYETVEEYDPARGGPPRFGTPELDPDETGAVSEAGWQIIENVNLTLSDFVMPYELTDGPDPNDPNAPLDAGRPIVLDLTIITPDDPVVTLADPAGAILVDPLPFEDRIVREPLLGPDQRAAAGEMLAMGTRDLTPDEYAQFMPGRQSYSDFLPVGIEEDAPLRPVALNRVRRADAIRVLEQYDALFLAEVTDPETGETEMVNVSDQIRDTLTEAWDQFQQQDLPAAEFLDWLERTPEHADALEIMRKLSQIVKQLGNVGLSPAEYRQVVRQVLRPVTPEELTFEQFQALVTGREPAMPGA